MGDDTGYRKSSDDRCAPGSTWPPPAWLRTGALPQREGWTRDVHDGRPRVRPPAAQGLGAFAHSKTAATSTRRREGVMNGSQGGQDHPFRRKTHAFTDTPPPVA